MSLVLHTAAGSKNAFKTLIAAEYCGVEVEVAKGFQFGVTTKTPEFIKMNPLGKSPVLQTPDGPVFESNAIARYVVRSKSDNSLYGSSLIDYAHVEQWIDFAANEIDAGIAGWLYPRLGYHVYLPPAEEASIAALKRALEALNTHLASNAYLVGHGVTLADIVTVCNLSHGFKNVMTKSFTSAFPHVERYFWTLVNLPNFKKIFGEVQQATAVQPMVSKKAETPAKAQKPTEQTEKEVKKEVVVEEGPPKLKPSQMIEDAEPFEGEALLDAKCFK